MRSLIIENQQSGLIQAFGNQTHDGRALQVYNSYATAAGPLQFKNDLITQAALVTVFTW